MSWRRGTTGAQQGHKNQPFFWGVHEVSEAHQQRRRCGSSEWRRCGCECRSRCRSDEWSWRRDEDRRRCRRCEGGGCGCKHRCRCWRYERRWRGCGLQQDRFRDSCCRVLECAGAGAGAGDVKQVDVACSSTTSWWLACSQLQPEEAKLAAAC